MAFRDKNEGESESSYQSLKRAFEGAESAPASSSNDFTLTRDQVNSLYQQHYGVTDDAQADAWVEWARNNGVKDLKGLEGTFRGAVTKDLLKQGMKELPKGAKSSDFITTYNTLIEFGMDPMEAYNQTKKELEEKFPAADPNAPKVETPEEKATRVEKELGEALNPENIRTNSELVKEMYNPEFNKQAKNIAEQYAGMGRDYKGDAYNKAMANLAGDFQSKAFTDAINLIQQGVQNKATGAGLGLDFSKLGMGSMLQDKQNSYSTLMSLLSRNWDSADYNQSAELVKEMARMQKEPDWAVFLDKVGDIIPG